MVSRIVVISGPFTGQLIPLSRGEFVIGRDSDCQFILDNDLASRHHCSLIADGRSLRIRDMGSKNGTFVNGLRLSDNEVGLSRGDLVSVPGVMSFRVESFEAELATLNGDTGLTQIDENAPAKEQAGPAHES